MDDIARLPDTGAVLIDREVIRYRGKSPALFLDGIGGPAGLVPVGAGSLLDAMRGTDGTTAAPHAARVEVRPVAPCTGACDADDEANIASLVSSVGIALGEQPLGQCPFADSDWDGEVTISELIRAVSNAIDGCVPG